MLSQKELEKKVDQSKFVFIGTIKKIGASNLAALEADKQLILVEINKVANAPGAFVGTVGTTVTVKIPASAKLKSGETKLFFTNKLMYAENLALEAIAIEQVDKDYDHSVKTVKKAIANLEREEQLARISKAILIVEGRVIRMEESEFNNKYSLSFKSPFWIMFIIQISRVIKGKYKGKTIEVFINKGGETEEATPLEIEIGKTGLWSIKIKTIFKDLKNNSEFYVIEEPYDFLNSYEYAMLIQPKLS
jgi:hypothetical protein